MSKIKNLKSEMSPYSQLSEISPVSEDTAKIPRKYFLPAYMCGVGCKCVCVFRHVWVHMYEQIYRKLKYF